MRSSILPILLLTTSSSAFLQLHTLPRHAPVGIKHSVSMKKPAHFLSRRRMTAVLSEAASSLAADEPEKSPTPPLSLDGTAKLQLGILLSTNFLIQMGIGMIIVTLPLFTEALGFGAAGAGLLIALPQLSKLVFNLPVGHLVDCNGRKPYLIGGALLDGIGQFLTASASTLGQLIPARLLLGVGSATGSVTGPATQAYTQDVVGNYPAHSGLILGIIQATGFLAFAAGPALGGAISVRAGPAVPFVLLGIMQLVTVPLKMLLPETLPKERRVGGGLSGLRAAMSGIAASYDRLLADRKQIALLGMKCSFLIGLSLILTVVPIQATAAWGATAADLGQLYSFVMLLSLVASPLAGTLADRVGRAPLAIGGTLVTACSVACVPLASGRGAYYAARAFWSLGEAFLITAYSALALDITPEEQRGARNSLDNQVGDVALLFLPLLFGILGSVSHQAAFWTGSSLMLLACAVFSRLLRD